MQIAFVSEQNPDDVGAWSGSVFHMREALRRNGFVVTTFGSIEPSLWARIQTGLWKFYFSKLRGQDFQRIRHPAHIKALASVLSQKLAGQKFDAIIAPSSVIVAGVKSDIPILFWTDAVCAGMWDFYPEMAKTCALTRRQGDAQEQLALDNCSYALFTSDWARQSALDSYRVSPEKVKTVRYGANLPDLPSRDDVESMIAARTGVQPIRFLFVGVDWSRKGGPKAYDVVAAMRSRGFDAELHVVGATVPEELPNWVIRHGYVKKNSVEGLKKFRTLMAQSQFNILPSIAECCAVVLNEAAAFGLPSLASNVGGITSAVIDGQNGFTFPLEAPASAYCDAIMPYVQNPEAYKALCAASYNTYHTLLSWDIAAAQVADLIKQRQSSLANPA